MQASPISLPQPAANAAATMASSTADLMSGRILAAGWTAGKPRRLPAWTLYKEAMRAVVQRVSRASVTVDTRVTGAIDRGLLVLLGAGAGDGAADLAYIVDKIVNLRIFPDDAGKMNRSVLDIAGSVPVVSQFTLYGDARQGRRPAFTGALEPALAKALYEQALVAIRAAGVSQVEAGEFAADMKVELTNDGPVTIVFSNDGW